MRILIATGIYPPAIGGPAQYAQHLKKEWEKMGNKVTVKTFTRVEYALPSLVRHLYFFLKSIPAVITCDFVYALDTFSVGWPIALLSKICNKKVIMRTGGDFLWENYVERSHDLVLFKDFYQTSRKNWTKKEELIYKITKKTLHRVSLLIFSTKWQRDIWMEPYELGKVKTTIVENFYGPKEESFAPTRKDFIAGTRPLLWKNIEVLKKVFTDEEVIKAGATYHGETCPHHEFMDKIAHSYASLLVSLGDISPNMILDTIRHNKPFIITQENGLMDRIGEIAIAVDPKSAEEIKEKVLWLCNDENYKTQVEKIKHFNFTHTWKDIAEETLNLYKTL